MPLQKCGAGLGDVEMERYDMDAHSRRIAWGILSGAEPRTGEYGEMDGGEDSPQKFPDIRRPTDGGYP